MGDENQTKLNEMVSLYKALAAAVGEEIADRLFPGAWRHLRKIRSREREHAYIEHHAQKTHGKEVKPS